MYTTTIGAKMTKRHGVLLVIIPNGNSCSRRILPCFCRSHFSISQIWIWSGRIYVVYAWCEHAFPNEKWACEYHVLKYQTAGVVHMWLTKELTNFITALDDSSKWPLHSPHEFIAIIIPTIQTCAIEIRTGDHGGQGSCRTSCRVCWVALIA